MYSNNKTEEFARVSVGLGFMIVTKSIMVIHIIAGLLLQM